MVDLFRQSLLHVWRALYRWTITEGLRRIDMDREDDAEVAPDASTTLTAIKEAEQRGVYLLLDFHPYLGYASTQRQLRDLAQRRGSQPHVLVLVGHKVALPDDLEALCVRFTPRLPDANALQKLVREEATAYASEHGGRRVEADAEVVALIVRQLQGMSLTDARRIARHLIFDDGVLGAGDLPALAKLKFALLNRSGHLHYEYDTARFADVAGAGRVKLGGAAAPGARRRRRPARPRPAQGPAAARRAGLRQVAAGQVGGRRLRRAAGAAGLRHAVRQVPGRDRAQPARRAGVGRAAGAVRAVDRRDREGARPGRLRQRRRRLAPGAGLPADVDGRTPLARIPGRHRNQVHELPPELLRKGRFDEIFFVDLPGRDARREVFALHLARRALAPDGYDLDALADASDGFSGAEIEQAIVAGLYAAHAADAPLTDAMLRDELAQTRPLSVVMAEQVAALRQWASGRTVPVD